MRIGSVLYCLFLLLFSLCVVYLLCTNYGFIITRRRVHVQTTASLYIHKAYLRRAQAADSELPATWAARGHQDAERKS